MSGRTQREVEADHKPQDLVTGGPRGRMGTHVEPRLSKADEQALTQAVREREAAERIAERAAWLSRLHAHLDRAEHELACALDELEAGDRSSRREAGGALRSIRLIRKLHPRS
jgi:acyl-CoA reductase-like NAD-dependent aldehyde dehydrogenase